MIKQIKNTNNKHTNTTFKQTQQNTYIHKRQQTYKPQQTKYVKNEQQVTHTFKQKKT